MSLFLLFSIAQAATLDRAPYLQMATPTGMTVVWRTDVDSHGRLLVGANSDSLTAVADAELARQHEVRVDGLTPATTYFYAVEVDGTVLDSERSFTTPPLPGSGAPLLAWIVGDSGTNSPIQHYVRDAMRAHLHNDLPDLFLHVGDMAYSSGTDQEFTERFYGPYADELSRVPVWPALGNHEGASADSVTNTGPYYEGYVLPTEGEAGGLASGTEAYYSFDWGDVHFVILDSHGSDTAPEGPMLSWLSQDLELTEQRWIVASFHHPPYTKGSHDSDRERGHIDMRENALPILEAGGVDLVVGGHSHIYERSYLAQGGYETPSTNLAIVDFGDGRIGGDGAYAVEEGLEPGDGTLFVVAGHGGTGVQREGRHPLLYWSEPDNGSVLMHIDGDALSLRNVRWDGMVTDTVSLVKGDPLVLGSPNGDHPLLAGVATEVRWAGARGDGDVTLELSCDGGDTWEDLVTTEDDGEWTWDVPLRISRDVQLRLRQLAHDREDVTDTDVQIVSARKRLAVPFASVHRHLTDGRDPGADWMTVGFDDSSWSEGRGPMGYGYDDELTLLDDPDGELVSGYFRHTFEAYGSVIEAIIRVEYDDAMVVFVNGQEAGRANLDTLEHGVGALAPADEPAREYELLDTALFREGTNTIAVMVQQHFPETDTAAPPPEVPDFRFDMSLELTEFQGQATERCPPDLHHDPEEDPIPELAPPPKDSCGCATPTTAAGLLWGLPALLGLLGWRRREAPPGSHLR